MCEIIARNDDIFLNWKKISRILPSVRRYALDRIPTTEEIRAILDVSDIRSKALTLVLSLSEATIPVFAYSIFIAFLFSVFLEVVNLVCNGHHLQSAASISNSKTSL
jgi:hypothetical protein